MSDSPADRGERPPKILSDEELFNETLRNIAEDYDDDIQVLIQIARRLKGIQ